MIDTVAIDAVREMKCNRLQEDRAAMANRPVKSTRCSSSVSQCHAQDDRGLDSKRADGSGAYASEQTIIPEDL